MTRQVLRCDQDGPGSRAEIVEYVEAVFRDNFSGFKPGVLLSSPDEDEKRHRLASGMVYSILHRLGIDQVANTETGEWG